jgi:ABC-type multidrug transport system ATPase subunit
MIAVHGLVKAYGSHRVLDDLSFDARPGHVTLLVGANGSGKSTTLRVATGLSTASAGRVEIDGHDLARGRQLALEALSYLPQSPRFHPHLTVRQVLQFYARLRGQELSRIDVVARTWGLAERLDTPTGRLSGGLRQRLALAVFSLPDAPVLALDEPGLSLDPDWRRFLQAELTAVARRGHTVLVATHLLGEWEGQADRCLVLEHGRVTRELPPDRLRDAFPFAVPHPAVAHAR